MKRVREGVDTITNEYKRTLGSRGELDESGHEALVILVLDIRFFYKHQRMGKASSAFVTNLQLYHM